MSKIVQRVRQNLWKLPFRLDRLYLKDIIARLERGHLGDYEPYGDWLRRAYEYSENDVLVRFAGYLDQFGVQSMSWRQMGNWNKDERVSVTYLVIGVIHYPRHIGKEIEYLSGCYDWMTKDEYSQSAHKRYYEIWLEFHSAGIEYRQWVLNILESTRVGGITYAMWLSWVGGSTDVGVASRVLTARGILGIRAEPDPDVGSEKWSTYLVVSLPASQISRKSNLPPWHMVSYAANTLRNTRTHFVNKTEVWLPFQLDLPLTPKTEAFIEELWKRKKWWR